MSVLEKVLNQARELANELSGKVDGRGMASVYLQWNPYEAAWLAYASWSDGQREYGEMSEDATDAALSLADALKGVTW